jgi:Tfp pilus assembly protein PilO
VTRTNKILIAAAATLALLAAYWFLVLAPKRQQVVKLDTSIATKTKELTTAQSTLATYRTARDGYGASYSNVVRLGKAVPQDDDTRSLLVQLDSAAHSSGVDFRTMAVTGGATPTTTASATGGGAATTPPGTMVGTAGFAVMPVTFSFRGNFFNMSQFFSRLEHFVTVKNQQIAVTGRLLRVESISLKPDTLGYPSLRADITASSYLIPASEGLTAGASASGPTAGTTTSTPATPGGAGTTTPPTTTATASGAIR